MFPRPTSSLNPISLPHTQILTTRDIILDQLLHCNLLWYYLAFKNLNTLHLLYLQQSHQKRLEGLRDFSLRSKFSESILSVESIRTGSDFYKYLESDGLEVRKAGRYEVLKGKHVSEMAVVAESIYFSPVCETIELYKDVKL